MLATWRTTTNTMSHQLVATGHVVRFGSTAPTKRDRIRAGGLSMAGGKLPE
jgi:hypothetical protein